MDKFLKSTQTTKTELTQEEKDDWNSLISVKEIIVGNLPTKKTPGTRDVIGDFYSTFKKEIIPISIQTLFEN